MIESSVSHQYEKFPYPPIPWIALPPPREGRRLSYEHGAGLAGETRSSDGIRLLVAGCGTLEPLIAAQANPRAREIVALDVSARSLSLARRRVRFARARNLALPLRRTRLAPVSFVHADLARWRGGQFDLVVASNVLHHCADPGAALRALAEQLRPGGLMRMVTYPNRSRVWMRECSRILRARGLGPETPSLRARAWEVIRELPPEHPARLTFETHPETASATGIVDAFFHSLEVPLSPLAWREHCAAAGLVLFAEDQAETSRSSFLDELLPEVREWDPWEKLQILDDALELCANPVLWLRREGEMLAPPVLAPEAPAETAREELGRGVRSARDLLGRHGIPIERLIERLRTEVGPRVSAPPRLRILPGLTLHEQDWRALI